MTRPWGGASLRHLLLQTSNCRQKNPEKAFWELEAVFTPFRETNKQKNTRRQSGIDNSLTYNSSQWNSCLNSISTSFSPLEDKDHLVCLCISTTILGTQWVLDQYPLNKRMNIYSLRLPEMGPHVASHAQWWWAGVGRG